MSGPQPWRATTARYRGGGAVTQQHRSLAVLLHKLVDDPSHPVAAFENRADLPVAQPLTQRPGEHRLVQQEHPCPQIAVDPDHVIVGQVVVRREGPGVIDQNHVPGRILEPVPLVGVAVVDEIVEHLGPDELDGPVSKMAGWRGWHATEIAEALRGTDPHDRRPKLPADSPLDLDRHHLQP